MFVDPIPNVGRICVCCVPEWGNTQLHKLKMMIEMWANNEPQNQ